VRRAGDTVIRTRSQSIVLMIVGLVGFVALANMARNGDSGPHGSIGLSVVGFVLAGICLVGCVRLARCAALIRSDGLLVRGPIRTTVLPWAAIEHFRVGRHGLSPRVCIVSCRDRREVVIWGIQGRGPALRLSTDPVNTLVAQLNDAVALHRNVEE